MVNGDSKTAVIYYSFTGSTRKIAEKTAGFGAAALIEIKPARKIGKIGMYIRGVFAAGGGKAWDIAPLGDDLSGYERIILCSPIWAGNVTPYVNAAIGLLPPGKTVGAILVSNSGNSNCRERLERMITARGCTFAGAEDIKSGKEK